MSNKRLYLDEFTESLASIYEFQKTGSDTNRNEYKKMLMFLKNVMEGELTDRQKICIALYYGEMLKMKDIAHKLHIGISSVSRHIKKAKYRIQKTMEYYYSIN